MAAALAAKDAEKLLNSLRNSSAEQFADHAVAHHEALTSVLQGNNFDEALDQLVTEANSQSKQTKIFDMWENALETALDNRTIRYEQKAKANAGRKQAPNPSNPKEGDIFGLKEAIRNDGQIRPDRVAEEAALGVKNAAKTAKHTGRAGLFALKAMGELMRATHNGIKTGGNVLSATHNGIGMTKGQKATAALVAVSLMTSYAFIDQIHPEMPGQSKGYTQSDLHPSAFCQNPSLWSQGGVMAAAWSVETYRANDVDNKFYQAAAVAALQQGMHPVGYWTLMGAETGFRDVIGTVAYGMTQNLVPTFLEKLGKHMEQTDFYLNLETRIADGTASEFEQKLKTQIDDGLKEYRSKPSHYHNQYRRDDKDPKVGPAVAFLASLTFQPEISAQIEVVKVLKEHPDLAARNFTQSEEHFQELFFELYDEHLPGPLGERLMDYAVDNGHANAKVTNSAAMATLLSSFSRDVRPLSAKTQRKLNGFFARVVNANPGPFKGVNTMGGFKQGLKKYADGKVASYAADSFAKASAITKVTDVCVTNPEALKAVEIKGVSRFEYATALAGSQLSNATGLTASDIAVTYDAVLDFAKTGIDFVTTASLASLAQSDTQLDAIETVINQSKTAITAEGMTVPIPTKRPLGR